MAGKESERYSSDSLTVSQAFIKEQAELLRLWIEAYNFGEIEVGSTSLVQTPEELFIKDRPTFGYIGAFSHEGSFATFLATGEDPRIATYFVTATDEESGLLADDVTGTLYTDSFWRLQHGTLQHITPTQPVPLDGIMMCWDGKEEIDPIIKSQYSKTTLQVVQAAANKITTKEILQSRGVPVPRLVVEGDLRAGKFALGAYGESVVLENTGNTRQYELAMKNLREQHDPSLIFEEQRHIPAPNPELAALFDHPVEPDKIDYTRRHLYTLGKHPQRILTFVRFGERHIVPVNKSAHASTARPEVMKNPVLSNNAEHLASKAIREIFLANYVRGDPKASPMIVGVDDIDDGNFDPRIGSVNTYINEVQPYPGVNTLYSANLGGDFRNKIPILISHMMPSVQERFKKRPPVKPKDLRRIPYVASSADNIYTSHSSRIQLQRIRGIRL